MKYKYKIAYCEKVIKSCKTYKQLNIAENLCILVVSNKSLLMDFIEVAFFHCVSEVYLDNLLLEQEIYIDKLKTL